MNPNHARFLWPIPEKKKVAVGFHFTAGERVCVTVSHDPIEFTTKPLQVSVLPTGGLPAATAFSSGGAAGLKL